MTAAVLAIDGGNSKTDVVLVAGDGSVLAHVRGPGSSPHRLGSEGCFKLLDQLVAEAVTQSPGIRVAEPIAEVAAVYLAGADLPREIVELQARLSSRGWAAKAFVENDTFALLRTGTDSLDAVAVVCGAGINCVGVRADGQQVRFPALGRTTGDWGGGWQLGEEALWAAARDEDGRGLATVLTHQVAKHFGFPTVAAIAEAIHFKELSETRLNELAPVLLAASADGDFVARAVVEQQAEEIVRLATSALNRLELIDQPAIVVLGGGVLAAGDHFLLQGIETRLARAAPSTTTVLVTARPVVGAALAGLDLLTDDPGARSRLRKELGGLA